MAIKRMTPMSQIMQYLDDEISAYEGAIIRRLQYMGERCIVQAREHGSYKDQTGNLRSSIGYIIVRNGQFVVRSAFDQVPPKKNVKGAAYDGDKRGASLAEEVAGEFNKGIVLIVVAGMEYAAYVEAKGYDVLTSSEILAEREVPKLLAKINLHKQ